MAIHIVEMSQRIVGRIVTKNGVERKPSVSFWIYVELTGDNPSLSIDFVYRADEDVHRVELDDCFPMDHLPEATVDSRCLFDRETLMCSHQEVIRSLIGAILARKARVELIYLKSVDAVRVNLIIMDRFKTQGLIPREQAEHFLVLPAKK